MANKEKTEKNQTSKFQRQISKKHIGALIITIIIIALAKAIIFVPVRKGSELMNCGIYDTHITLPEYIQSEVISGCDMYKVLTASYIAENIITLIISSVVVFGLDEAVYLYRNSKRAKKSKK